MEPNAPDPTLDAIRARLAAITPGTWSVRPFPGSATSGCRDIKAMKSGEYKQAQWRVLVASTSGLSPDRRDKANAEFIAAAPDLLRWAADRIEALERALLKIEDYCETHQPGTNHTEFALTVWNMARSGLFGDYAPDSAEGDDGAR